MGHAIDAMLCYAMLPKSNPWRVRKPPSRPVPSSVVLMSIVRSSVPYGYWDKFDSTENFCEGIIRQGSCRHEETMLPSSSSPLC